MWIPLPNLRLKYPCCSSSSPPVVSQWYPGLRVNKVVKNVVLSRTLGHVDFIPTWLSMVLNHADRHHSTLRQILGRLSQALVSSGALFGLDEDRWGLFEGKHF